MVQLKRFFVDFLSRWSVHWGKWSVENPNYYCIGVLTPFRCVVWHWVVCIYNCYVFLVVPFHGFLFKFCFICYEYSNACSLLVSIPIVCLFQPFTFSLYVSLSVKWILYTACSWVFFVFKSTWLVYVFWLVNLMHLHSTLLLTGMNLGHFVNCMFWIFLVPFPLSLFLLA
jgi:hypothetical protein